MAWSLLPVSPGTFNWPWVVGFVVCILLVNWFLFYFNRLCGTVVSFLIRTYTWHRYRAWIDIGAIQLSLLGGRLFIKQLRYHAENETILIQQGFITWRYWMPYGRQVDLLPTSNADVDETDPKADASSERTGSIKSSRINDNAEARIAINITGLEWFVYNRTPAYDAIIAANAAAANATVEGGLSWPSRGTNESIGDQKQQTVDEKASYPTSSSAQSSLAKGHHISPRGKTLEEAPESITRVSTASTRSDDQPQEADVSSFYPLMLKFLPVGVECSKGAISLGNEGTRAIVVSTFAKAKGHIDATCADATDIFRQVFDFEFEHPVIQMKPNPDYRRPQRAFAERIIQGLDVPATQTSWWHRLSYANRRKTKATARHHLKKLIPGFRSSEDSFLPHSLLSRDPPAMAAVDESSPESNTVWHGLDRYLDENDGDDHEAWAHIDYARFSTILDSPALHFNFYWDQPGTVTAEDLSQSNSVNGSPPPAYGMRLVIRGGDVNYGPWADRLRLEVQSAFFPAFYMPTVPAERLKAGDLRQYSRMAIDVEVDEDVALRVPTREESKDWQWRGRAQAAREAAIQHKHREKKHFRFRRAHKPVHGNNVRPFGWFNFTVGKKSVVNYDLAMLPDSTGYPNSLHISLNDTRVTSSVNHALLWRCPTHKIHADLSYPLQWNDLHKWSFNVESDQLDMFLLRDHMFLLVDLISDFTAGRKPDFMTFVPYHYQIGLLFHDLKLYLNANDFNIIDKPNDMDANAFLILGFSMLNGTVGIPLEFYEPRQSQITFKADGTNGFLDISTPTWNTLNTLLDDPKIPDLKRLLLLKGLALDGSFNYWASVAPNQTDSLFMNVTGSDPRFHLHGFLIRSFMNIKDNYFGDHLHFRTLEEYQDLIHDPDMVARLTQRPVKKVNDLDVILTVHVHRSAILVPANIYTRRRGLRADVLLIEADMRFTNYYMDLQLNTSPIECALETIGLPGEPPDVSSCQLFIESLTVVGHRLYGAPPAEPAYAGHWDIDLGFVSGQISSFFLQTLILSVQALIFAVDDYENALPPVFVEPVHDVSFVRARASGLRVWLLSGHSAFLLDLAPLVVNFDDWAGQHFAKHVDVNLPGISVGAVDLESALHYHEHRVSQPETFALFKTSLRLAVLDKSKDLTETRALQQHYIKYHDQRTHRADRLLHPSHHSHVHRPAVTPEWARDEPYMPLPSFPWPITDEDDGASTARPRIQQKSSFLSLHSSSGSVRKSRVARQKVRQQKKTRDAAARNRPTTLKPSEPGHERTSFASVVHASSWATPYFSLQDVVLDERDLPELPERGSTTHRHRDETVGLDALESQQAKDVAHMGVLCLLENGLVGFCMPAFMSSIATLIKELQPQNSLDRLDTLQREVIGLVVKRYAPKEPSQDLDIGVRLPTACIRLKNGSVIAEPLRSRSNDHYDISIQDGHADCRLQSRQNTDDADFPLNPTAMVIHTSVRHLGVSVSDNAIASSSPAYSSLTLADIGIWFSSAELLKGTVQVNSVVGEVGAAQTKPMAALLHRTTDLIEGIVAKFVGLDDSCNTRHLVYHLTQAATTTASDPVFLTRPAYVLRTASVHPRASESWKILARLRNSFTAANIQQPQLYPAECACCNEELDEQQRQQILKTFDQWQTWDGSPNDKAQIVTALFGPDVQSDGTDAGPKPLQLELLFGHVAVVLDPGIHQTAVYFNSIATDVFLDPTSRQSAVAATKLSIQTHVSDIDLVIDWAIVELAANLLDIIQASESNKTGDKEVTERAPPTKTEPLLVEIVVGADLASITATSENLRLKLGSELFRASVFLVPGKNSEMAPVFSVASTTAMSKLEGRQRSLLGWKLSGPKLCGSVMPPDSASAKPRTVKIAAACDKLRFSLREDIPALLGVVQRVVDQEIEEVYRQFSHIQLPTKAESERRASESTSLPSHVDFHLAMFLDDYKMDLVLLPALRYGIKGRVARSSVTPRGIGKFAINFDLERHEHSFSGIWAKSFEAPAVLQMPSVNGRISVMSIADITTLRAHATVDLVEFEASAVRACFDVINQPGFLNSINSIRAKAKNLQASTSRIFDPQEQLTAPTKKPSTSVFRFGVDGTFAGIKIHCVAPNSRQGEEAEAHLNFWLGPTAVRVSNIMPGSVQVYERPQFNIAVHDVGLGLYRTAPYGGRLNHGKVSLALRMSGVTEQDGKGNWIHVYHLSSSGINMDLFQESASLVVDIAAFLQARLKSITISEQAKNLKPIRRFTLAALEHPKTVQADDELEHAADETEDSKSSCFFDSVFSLNVDRIQLRWGLHEDAAPISPGRPLEDLVFSIRKIEFRTRREGSARLSIQDLQLQLVPHHQDLIKRTANSALLPEVIFSAAYLSTGKDRRFAFQAKGKALDLRLAADFVVPATQIQRALGAAGSELRSAKDWLSTSTATPEAKLSPGSIMGSKRLASLLVDADFAGAIFHISPRQQEERNSAFGMLKGPKRSKAGRYNQAVHGEGSNEATLQAPGVAVKVEYHHGKCEDDPTLRTEIKVAASSNTLYPSVVPLILDISSSIKEVLGDGEPTSKKVEEDTSQTASKYLSDATIKGGDPTAILGPTKLIAGLWVQKQEFSLSCQPIARVSATARFDDISLIVNTVQGPDQSRFFSILTTFNNLQASVQHVYSRESTASFDVDSIVISLMNSKHVSGTTGISAILNVSPVKTDLNAKQMQDFLLFREIWYPAELRGKAKSAEPPPRPSETQAFAIQKYQQMTVGQGTLPWNAIVSIQELKMRVDWGPTLGKSTFNIKKFWVSSNKNSDAEQNLCIGFDKVGVESSGRMSGFVELQNVRVRSGIRWPAYALEATRAPLIQASIGFDHLRVKGAFDYQTFLVADVSYFEPLMYNVHKVGGRENDRLVAILSGGKIQVFCTALAGAQGLALFQAFERLVEEKREAYEESLQELDKFLRRRSAFPSVANTTPPADSSTTRTAAALAPIDEGFSLHTDVVVSLKAIDLGVFPSTFFDNQILKVTTIDTQTRFAVATTKQRTHSALGMRLGEVRVALASVSQPTTKALDDVSVEGVIERATTARGGTILKVPRLVSSMQTWQTDHSNVVEYIFRSTFEGKIDVGWNYSRISFIRGMWQTHSRALAQRLGKPLPEPAVKITAEPASTGEGKEKITAVVNMPTSSKYIYIALEPPIIDTPQLRDMGEATPPLEWIGLHRDRLPEATHSVAIVSLLEVAREVEDAYWKERPEGGQPEIIMTDAPPSVPLSFSNNFWGRDDAGVDPLLTRMHNAKTTSDELKSFYSARAAIEDDYARKMLQLSRKPLGSVEQGSLRASLDVARGETESMGKQHALIAQQIRTECEEPLAAFAGSIKERRKIIQNGVERLLKTKQNQTAQVNKARDKYEQDCLRIKGYLAQGHMVMGQEERKNKAKLEKTQINMASNSNDYEAAVKALEETTMRWNKEWKAACDKFQDLEEERIDFTKSSLWAFANTASTVCVSDDASCEKIRLALEKCEVEKDISSFIMMSGTGQEIPDPPKFINFCRGDLDTASETSDGEYTVAQFARTTNPAFRSASPAMAHAAPVQSSVSGRGFSEERAMPEDNEPTPNRANSGRPPPLNYKQADHVHVPPDYSPSQHGPLQQVPHNQFPMDGMTQFCRNDAPSRADTAYSSSGRPGSRDNESELSAPSSFTTADQSSRNPSPTKHLPGGVGLPGMTSAPPSPEKSEQRSRIGIFNSPFRRKSKKELNATSSEVSTRSAYNVAASSSRINLSQHNPPSSHSSPVKAAPKPVDRRPASIAVDDGEPVAPGASFQLNVGNNVFDVDSPDNQNSSFRGPQQLARRAMFNAPLNSNPPASLDDPISAALADLTNKTGNTSLPSKQSSHRDPVDRYHGIHTPAPDQAPEQRPPTMSDPARISAQHGRTPPPAYDTMSQAGGPSRAPGHARAQSVLGVPQPAHTKKEMIDRTRTWGTQPQGGNAYGGSASSPARPVSRNGDGRPVSRNGARSPGPGSYIQTNPQMRARSPAPSAYPRAASPNPMARQSYGSQVNGSGVGMEMQLSSQDVSRYNDGGAGSHRSRSQVRPQSSYGGPTKALYSYAAAIPEELSFAKGDVLGILRLQDDGWWEAQVKESPKGATAIGGLGLVPSNYLHVC
ncbi:hypothetical protein DV735_g4267, partial [Chaetothyriales sp. CBS 134920]